MNLNKFSNKKNETKSDNNSNSSKNKEEKTTATMKSPEKITDFSPQIVPSNYKSVMDFLKSPLWKIPLISFIDENCIYFENQSSNNSEIKIHNVNNQFKL